MSRELRQFHAKVDRLANLRQTGREYAESVILGIFGGVTILVALLVYPKIETVTPQPWTSFVLELLCTIIAAAVAFLVFNLFDKQDERDSAILRRVSTKAQRKHHQPPGYRLNFSVFRNIDNERRISTVTVLGVLLTVTWLLYDKWF